MKKFLLPALLLLASTAHATLYNWNGTLDYGADPQNVSGDFEATGNQLWSMDFNVGPEHYIFQPQFYAFFDSEGGIVMSDVPLSGNITGDLQLDQKDSLWAFNSGADNASEFGGHISSFFRRDAAPTPEPSSLVMMGAALVGFGLIRWRRSTNQY